MKAMIFAAGLGTRLKPLTLAKPKALIELNGETLLGLQIKKLIGFGFNEIIVNVHHFAEQIINFLASQNNFGIRIAISDESGEILDTGGGLKKAAWFFDDGKPFLLHNVDVVTNLNLKEFYGFHLQQNSLATLAVRIRETTRFLLFDDRNTLIGWENISTGEKIIKRETEGDIQRLAFSGISVLSPEVLTEFPDKKVFSLIDLFLNLAAKGKITAYIENESYWFDIGTKEKLFKAERFLKDT